MLTQLRPKTHPAYRSLPILGPIVDEFTDWVHRCGYEAKSFGSQLGNIRHVAQFFHRCGVRSLKELMPLHFDAAWKHLRKKNRSRGCVVRQVQRFLREVHGLVEESCTPATRSESEVRCYAEYLQRVRGFAEHTIASHVSSLRAFLKFIGYDRSTSAIPHLAAERVNKLMQLSSYVGHVSLASTHYYLQLTPQLREAANQRFHQSVTPLFEEGGIR